MTLKLRRDYTIVKHDLGALMQIDGKREQTDRGRPHALNN